MVVFISNATYQFLCFYLKFNRMTDNKRFITDYEYTNTIALEWIETGLYWQKKLFTAKKDNTREICHKQQQLVKQCFHLTQELILQSPVT